MRVIRTVAFWVVAGLAAMAQSPELPTIERHGDYAALTVNTSRPLDAIATAFDISAEDPFYMFSGDMMDISLEISRIKPGTLVPKRQKLTVSYPINPDGSAKDRRKLFESIVETENAQSPFAYRLDTVGGFFFVPTGTHDAQGRLIEVTPLLDRKVSIPLGTRMIRESAELLANDLSKQTGLQVFCCQSVVAGIPWGMETISFEANNEPARSVLKRLGLNQWHVRCVMESCVIDMR
ncbi:MAG: hypothetical protein DMG57_04540 [Acidobacteria bacterium]|nr:MAG: hypothetical protein DMG57_04540 [Acidobacteriota bacterium]